MSDPEWMTPLKYADYEILVKALEAIASYSPGSQVPVDEVIYLQKLARDALFAISKPTNDSTRPLIQGINLVDMFTQ